jgi:hypothetical protein
MVSDLFVNLAFKDFREAELLAGAGVARRKAWPAVEKCLLKFSIIMDLSVVIVLPNLSVEGSWEEVLLFSKDFTVSQNFLELELQDANFCLKKLAFAFLTDCVYWFLTSLNSCISRGLSDAIKKQGVFVLAKGSQFWSEPRAISVLSSTYFERGMLKMVRKLLF